MNRFSIFPASAVLDKRLSPRDLSVLAAIGVHADKNGWCFPSMARLGEMLGVTRQAVQKSVRVLVECRYVEMQGRIRQDGGQGSNQIRVLFDVIQPDDEMRKTTVRQVAPPATPEVAPPATPEVAPPATPEVAPPATPEVAPPATPEVAPPATPEVAHNVPINDPYERSSSLRSEGARKRTQPTTVERPDDVSEEVWRDWLTLRRAKKAPVTATVLKGARQEAEKAQMPLEAFLEIWCQRGSQGLKAEWLAADKTPQIPGKPHANRSELDPVPFHHLSLADQCAARNRARRAERERQAAIEAEGFRRVD